MHRDIRASASKSYRRCLPRFAAALGLALLAFAAAPDVFAQEPAAAKASSSPAPATSRIELSADRITYYSDRALIVGEDRVNVLLGDGTKIAGSLFSMDLKLNRFLVAGGVHVAFRGGALDGAAFSSFLNYDRTYFVPIASEPDRWTFFGADYAHPLKGRDMPGDTFFLPDTSNQHVFLMAKHAMIVPKQSVAFRQVRINTLGSYAPLPDYFLTFSTNPNFSANSLAGAYIDAPVPFAGSANSLETAHLRYDQVDKLFASYEQHVVSDRGYIVASVNPATRPQKQYNLGALDRISPSIQAQTFLQESAFQHGFGYRLSASGFANFTVTGALPNSYVQAYSNFYYTSLLPQPPPGIGGALYYGDPSHPWEPDHPSNAQLSWNGFDHRINKLPLNFKLRSGMGFAHDPYVAEAFLGGTFYDTLWYKYAGATVYTPAFKLGSGGYLLNGVVDKQRAWFSVPHHVDTTNTSISLSRSFGTKLASFVAYQVNNTGDFYGARQSEVYPPILPGSVLPFTSGTVAVTAPDYLSYRGFSTYRAFIESATFTPNPYFQAAFSMRESRDYPQPVAPAPPNFLYGRPPLEADMDMRLRLNRTLLLDIGRSYFFGFGNLHWSPQFSIRTGP